MRRPRRRRRRRGGGGGRRRRAHASLPAAAAAARPAAGAVCVNDGGGAGRGGRGGRPGQRGGVGRQGTRARCCAPACTRWRPRAAWARGRGPACSGRLSPCRMPPLRPSQNGLMLLPVTTKRGAAAGGALESRALFRPRGRSRGHRRAVPSPGAAAAAPCRSGRRPRARAPRAPPCARPPATRRQAAAVRVGRHLHQARQPRAPGRRLHARRCEQGADTETSLGAARRAAAAAPRALADPHPPRALAPHSPRPQRACWTSSRRRSARWSRPSCRAART
jgi:hypothetical protein